MRACLHAPSAADRRLRSAANPPNPPGGTPTPTLRQVIFTDPYHPAAHNRHTAPQLNAEVAALHADVPARVAAAQLKARSRGLQLWRRWRWQGRAALRWPPAACSAAAACPMHAFPPDPQAKFASQHQALLHGDLHTGSVMATGERRAPPAASFQSLLSAVGSAGPASPRCPHPHLQAAQPGSR